MLDTLRSRFRRNCSWIVPTRDLIYMYIYIYIYIYIYTHTPSTSHNSYIYIYVCMYVCMCVCVCVIGSKHTVYFAQDKIKCADVVGSINHVTFLTNSFSKLISLPKSAIFVSGTRESESYFLEFSCIKAILKI